MEKDIYVMTYLNKKTKKEKNIRIIGKEFAKRNKNEVKLIYKNKKIYFGDLFINSNVKEDIFKIKMILVNNSYNKNSLFENCKFLLKFSITQEILDNISEDIVKEDNDHFIDEFNSTSIANSESSIDYFEEISRKTENNKSTIDTIKETKSQINDILIKQNQNFNNMSRMFYNCSSLKSLPGNLAYWNTKNVIDMNGLFYRKIN